MRNKNGQTALILILLSAAALIFLAITINWGRIAQTKVLVTMAADQGASLLASDTASYGEEQKQTYLKNTNQLTESTGILLAIIMVVVSIVVMVVTWYAGGSPGILLFLSTTAGALSAISVVLAVVNLVLQLAVIQPGITRLWNSLQKSQPIQQQFFEGGISSALGSTVTDQVTITDYFDTNANGLYGFTGRVPNDTIGRFAVFYTDRLKMLNQPLNPQLVFFYNQLGELMNGKTCGQSQDDNFSTGLPVDPSCQNAGVEPFTGGPPCTLATCSTTGINCILDPINPICQAKVLGSFQLNDACPADSNTGDATYNPYCDPCCQATGRPSYCLADVTAECQTNNPYNLYGPYIYLYDPTYQNYAAGKSFLAQFGRDMQLIPPGSLLPLTNLALQGNFPNGIYPFFWLMKDYSLQVDNINYAALQPSQDHWCTSGVAPGYTAPAGFLDLAQLVLQYPAQGQDNCVNDVFDSVTFNAAVTSNPLTIVLTSGPQVSITSPASGSYFEAGTTIPITITATETGATIASVALYSDSGTGQNTLLTTFTAPANTSPYSYNYINPPAGSFYLIAVATDSNGATGTTTPPVTINVLPAPTVSVTGPLSGTNFTAGSTITITADASTTATGDSISNVAFYNGTTLLGTVTSSPYSFSWTNVAAGNYNITAVATDQKGFTTTSSAVTGTIT